MVFNQKQETFFACHIHVQKVGRFAAISALNPTDPVPKMAMLHAGTLVPEHSRDERPVRESQISVTQIRVAGDRGALPP